MGKIAQVSVKYIIHATLKAEGLVARPDIIGAIFGQSEGLLGKEMELRELQKSGRIGRINVETFDKNGKTRAKIKVPSSLDKTKTAIIAAAIETIERIGPCNGKISLDKIEDVRNEKRDYIQERAKQILSKFIKESEETGSIAREVSESVKTASVVSYGKPKLAAGPKAGSSDTLILVEGRADVLALLRAGVENVISVNGTKIPKAIAGLMKKKKTNIAFVDGDRGGDLIVKALSQVGHLDFVAKAPDGKEVEELVSKEVLQCLRSKTPFKNKGRSKKKHRKSKSAGLSDKQRAFVKKELKDLSGKDHLRVYDDSLKQLGELPVSGLKSVRGLSDVFLIVADAPINKDLFFFAIDNGASVLVGSKLETRKRSKKLKVFTKRTL
ncbi:DNA primase [archaeon]|nr:DNA primase [archaeon]